jgi:hypothetical protein
VAGEVAGAARQGMTYLKIDPCLDPVRVIRDSGSWCFRAKVTLILRGIIFSLHRMVFPLTPMMAQYDHGQHADQGKQRCSGKNPDAQRNSGMQVRAIDQR